jgi:AAA+ superfamily predicted ATPase
MCVYVCISSAIYNAADSGSKLTFKGNLSDYLKKYYDAVDVQLSDTPNASIVYVMGTPKYEGHDTDIQNNIVSLVTASFKVDSVEVRLHYGRLFPNFKPPVVASTSAVRPNAPVQNVVPRAPAAIAKANSASSNRESDEFDYEKLSKNYQSEEPRYSFAQVVLSDSTREQIEDAIGIIEVEHKVFDDWGLREIIPTATSALSFYGLPGTGKSMAAEAVAQKMGRKILRATYADIESKFHGEGPKMVKAIFRAAERDNAVLFLDESDSLLSKRLTNVSAGSEQAINSMRSQLLISLENFKGVVIFATNLVINYDKAFLSRLINIEFTMPDVAAREKIWTQHLIGKSMRIPLGADVNIGELSANYEFVGREVRNAVKTACVTVARAKREQVVQDDLIRACERIQQESEKAILARDHTNANVLSNAQNDTLKATLQKKISSGL